MPRRSSGGRSGSAHRAAPMRNAPMPVRPAPPSAPVQRSGSMMGGLAASVADGMALGTGVAVAHRAVDAVLGPRTMQHEMAAPPAPATVGAAPLSASGAAQSAAPTDACSVQFKAFQDCINSSVTEISRCQFYMDMLKECHSGHTGATIGV